MSADLRAIGAQTDGGPKKQRNSGMDILRILAMLFICALHCDERGLGVHVGADAVSQGVRDMLAWVSTFAFGVYLFHCHHLTWGVSSKIILRMGFAIDFAWWGWVMIPVAIYAMGTCVDWGRSCLFKWVGINRLSERLSAAAADVVNKWIH